jgi:hypothetical protein
VLGVPFFGSQRCHGTDPNCASGLGTIHLLPKWYDRRLIPTGSTNVDNIIRIHPFEYLASMFPFCRAPWRSPNPPLIIVIATYQIPFNAALIQDPGCMWNDNLNLDIDITITRSSFRPVARGATSRWYTWIYPVLRLILDLNPMQLLPPMVMSCSIVWLVLAALYPSIKASPFVQGRSGFSYHLGRADRLKNLQRRLDCTYSTKYGCRLPGTIEHHMSHCYKPALCASRYKERSKFHSCTIGEGSKGILEGVLLTWLVVLTAISLVIKAGISYLQGTCGYAAARLWATCWTLY